MYLILMYSYSNTKFIESTFHTEHDILIINFNIIQLILSNTTNSGKILY